MRLLIAVLLFASSSVFAQDITYSVDLLNTKEHKVLVTIDLKKSGAKVATYQMPAWAPGAYAMTNYGRFVSDFKATGIDGKAKRVEKIGENRWKIYDAKDLRQIKYNVGNSYKDSTSLYFALCHIDTNFFFANGTALFGYVNDKKNVSCSVEYAAPYEWSLFSAERSEQKPGPADSKLFSYHYKNYDELADAPVMGGTDFQVRSFTEGKTQYDVVVASDKPFEMDSLTDLTKRIVNAETQFFGDAPFTYYSFLINAPTFLKLPSMAQGALEHSSSSAYLLVNLPWETFRTFGPHILSHEFFHAWNVKRIHSDLLGPFDYTKRVKTTSLWLSEGVTDYYSYTLLARNGIDSKKKFYAEMENTISANNFSHSAKTKSLEALSIAESDFDMENASAFYSKGTLVGMMLDIEIRTQSSNSRSLDDVMKALYAEAKKGKAFKDKELIGKMEKIAKVNLKDFYKKFIAGTDSLHVEGYLNKMALTKYATGEEKEEQMGVAAFMDPKTSKMVLFINTLDTTSHYYRSGLRQGDKLLAMNGTEISMDNAQELATKAKENDKTTMTVGRNDERKDITVTKSDEPVKKRKGIGELPGATDLQRAIRKAIVGL